MPGKLIVFKQTPCGFPTCQYCRPGRQWLVIVNDSGQVIAQESTHARALEAASAALSAEVCS